MESLITIHGFVKNDEQKEAVEKHLKLVLGTGKSTLKNYSDLKERFDNIQEASV